MAQFLLGVAGIIAGVGYVVACWMWPFENCPRCHGSGRRHSPSGKAFGWCRKCKGEGKRIRFGRRAWIWLSRQSKV